MFLFGLPFFGVGTWAALAGTKTIPIDPTKLHAPYWVLTAFGTVFAAAGLLIWCMAWQQYQAKLRQRNLLAKGYADPALLDYAWEVRGYTPPRWSRVAKALAGVAGLATFLSLFNWWAFCAPGTPWLLKGIVMLFDAFLAFAVWKTALLVGRTLKFSASRIEFTQFPFRPGETAVLQWQVPRGLHRLTKGTITLRNVMEWYEVSGSGNKRRRHLVQEQLWSGTQHYDSARELHPNQFEEIRFEIPAAAASTSLSGDKTLYWELVMDLDLVGLDFKETYLVPVYRTTKP